MVLDVSRINQDIAVAADKLPGYRIVSLDVNGSKVCLYILLPDGSLEEKRPCVLQFHGFPGFVKNEDLAQALRRAGCVVVMLYNRGAWGSEGTYSFTHNIEDCLALAEWIRRPELLAEYHIDPDRIVTLGHSMGGCTTINAVRRLPWIRSMVLLAPYDLAYHFEHDSVDQFQNLLTFGGVLKTDSDTSMFEDAEAHWKEYAFSAAHEDLKDRNILLIGADYDPLVPPAAMLKPFWEPFAKDDNGAVHRYADLPTTHGFDSHRNALIQLVADFLAEVLA